MYDGTLATKGPWQALVTFQQMLILCDKEGVIDMTAEAISRRTTIPLEIIQIGIPALEDIDQESRSPELEGRRIIRLADNREWGWQIVNYAKYRLMRSQEDRREYMRLYQQERRKGSNVNNSVNNVSNVNQSSKQKQKQVVEAISAKRGSRLTEESIPQAWIEFCQIKRPDLDPADTFESFKDYWTAVPGTKGSKSDWFATWRNWVKTQRQTYRAQVTQATRPIFD
jgi:hypothetical protein